MTTKTDTLAERNGAHVSIVHFDATVVRRDKMRDKAVGAPSTRSATANASHGDNGAASPAATDKPQPAVETPATAPAPATESTSAAGVTVTAKDNAPPPEQLEEFLINFVVEQTGYPAEIVEMDADLEADLGIDSIKKAQLFGELREFYDFDMAAAENMSLDDFPTLRHVMAFLAGDGENEPATSTAKPETSIADDTQVAAADAGASNEQPSTPPAAEPPVEAPAAAGAPAIKAKDNAPPPEQLEEFLINFVVEQTGYPAEIVEMDADLEADLGIDSIKKAQLFGELREYFEFDMAAMENLSLDDFPTLRDVMNFLQGGSDNAAPNPESTAASVAEPQAEDVPVAQPASPAAEPAVAEPTTAQPTAAAARPAAIKAKDNAPPPEQLEEFLINFVVEQTGYPAEIVEMDADLEADLGIDSIKKAQLFGELREYFEFDMEAMENLSLDDFPTLRDVMKFLQDDAPASQPAAPAAATEPAAPAIAPETVAAAPAHPPQTNGRKVAVQDASVFDAMRRIIIERGIAEPARVNITRNTRLMDDVGLDSVGMLDLITAVEQEFDISISLDDLEIEGLNSSTAFASLIQRKLAETE